jgi:hypothetical protein
VSISVSLEHLPAAVARRAFAYVMTVSAEGRAHVLAVQVVPDGLDLVMDVGRRTTSNVAVRPELTLVFPPVGSGDAPSMEHDAYSLVVDGTGSDRGGRLVVRPTGAVMHRPAPPFTPTDTPAPTPTDTDMGRTS